MREKLESRELEVVRQGWQLIIAVSCEIIIEILFTHIHNVINASHNQLCLIRVGCCKTRKGVLLHALRY